MRRAAPAILACLALLAACGDTAAPGAPPAALVVPLSPPLPVLPLPPVAGPADRPLVVIDAGHGGHDPGAGAGGLAEKDVTLAAAGAVARRMVAGGRLRVALTRSADRFLALRERWQIAQRLGADLFVSIHADAAPGAGGSGATVYTLAETASDAEAARTARRENEADLLAGADRSAEQAGVRAILADLTERETHERAARFADLVVREADGRVPLRRDPRAAAALLVLRAPEVPSVLVEIGYLTSAADRGFLTSERGRAAIAATLTDAAEAHFATAPRPGNPLETRAPPR